MIQLSPHFSLEELTFSQVASRKGFANAPNEIEIANLTRLCITLLEPARLLLGVPLHVDSGFRAPLVNAAVGGALNSAHKDGRAADLIPIGMPLQQAFEILRASDLLYDQLIREFPSAGWIHIAIAEQGKIPKRQVLIAQYAYQKTQYLPYSNVGQT
jgi:hypothetical protein